jgi:hypothetical protein
MDAEKVEFCVDAVLDDDDCCSGNDEADPGLELFADLQFSRASEPKSPASSGGGQLASSSSSSPSSATAATAAMLNWAAAVDPTALVREPLVVDTEAEDVPTPTSSNGALSPQSVDFVLSPSRTTSVKMQRPSTILHKLRLERTCVRERGREGRESE